MKHSSRALSAFTLVELSIVLVILGLLVGGVLSGQSLIRAAELRAVTREYQQYQTALGTFKDKYFAMPGDMPNAVKYWGAQAGSATADGIDSTCRALTTPATGLPTCNGNGNGDIGSTVAGTDNFEWWRAWQHLANAGLIEGTYSGIATGSWAAVIGTNVPRSKVSGAGWTMLSPTTWAGSGRWFNVRFGIAMTFGSQVSGDATDGPIIGTDEAYNVDMKLDDGKPNTGRVVGNTNSFQPLCVNGTNDAYILSNTGKPCSLIFITGY